MPKKLDQNGENIKIIKKSLFFIFFMKKIKVFVENSSEHFLLTIG